MKKGCLITIIILLLAAVGFVGWLYFNIKIPIERGNNTNIMYEVKEGEGSFEIGDGLKEKDLIRTPWVFAYWSKFRAVEIFPGIYYFQKGMNVEDMLAILKEKKIEEYKFTIPEGWRLTQIAEYLAEKKIAGKDEFTALAKDKEGYLFPDTYRVSVNATAKEIFEKMTDNFTTRVQGLSVTKDELTLASIVEREAARDADRAKIAGVYLNRLERDMYLGADPTIQYAKGNWEQLTSYDLEMKSPYNTYINKGLPPTPICNPGLASIKAVLKPEKNGWLFFFHLKDGTTIFSQNAQDHDASKAKYKDQIAN